MNIIEVYNLKKDYYIKDLRIEILKGINLKVEEGMMVSLIGQSGSGKTTLLNILAGLMPPSSGDILICNKLISNLTEDEICNFRRGNLGFVFQSYNLIPHFTALDNVAYPLIYSKISKKERAKRANEMLSQVGLGDRVNHKPDELSGGQKQRVSIARALINNPKIIFADEPTGNLDSKSAKEIIELIKDINKKNKTTFVIVTHSYEISLHTHKVIKIKDGLII